MSMRQDVTLVKVVHKKSPIPHSYLNVKLIVFDVDDTLVNAFDKAFYAQYGDSVEKSIASYFALSRQDAKMVANHYRKTMQGGQYALYKGDITDVAPHNTVQKPNYSILHRHLASLDPTGSFENQSEANTLLKTLRQSGIIVIALTSSPTTLAKKIMQESGYNLRNFDDIIGYEPHSIPPKMARDGAVFRQIASKYQIEMKSLLTVGDKPIDDVDPAVKLGAYGIIIGDGESSIQDNEKVARYKTAVDGMHAILKQRGEDI